MTKYLVMKLKMKHVSLAEAKANLSRLVTAAEAGETIEITRRGRVVARLTPAARPLKPIDFDALRRLTEGMKPPDRPFQQFLDDWKDDEERL